MNYIPQPTNHVPISVDIVADGDVVRLDWPGSVSSRFHAFWLRDNGHDIKTRDPGSWQKLISLSDIPERTRVESAQINNKGELALSFSPDHWTTVIPIHWLWEHRYDVNRTEQRTLFRPSVTTWSSQFSTDLPTVSFHDARTKPQALRDWLSSINQYGIALMEGLPIRPQSVLEVVQLFGYPRQISQDRFFEIKAVNNPANLAYSALGLAPHTDNPYRDPVPTLQLFACLQNDAQGGESIVVDGFKATERLHQESPEKFALLKNHSAQFDFHGDGQWHLRSRKPIIECSPEGLVVGVRFNNRSSDALTGIPFDTMPAYYAAYRRFDELLSSDELKVDFRLEPGQLFITDNTRVLHARRAFYGGTRWMQGAYADKDALRSKLMMLNKRWPARQ